VLDQPELLRACRRNALRFARDDFNWQNHGGIFLKLYRGEFRNANGASRLTVPAAPEASDDAAKNAGSLVA
jgi:hypothetical protein